MGLFLNRPQEIGTVSDQNPPALRAAPFTKGNNILDTPDSLCYYFFMSNEFKTLIDAIRYFSDEDTCVQFMVSLRWPDGVTCPTCESKEVSYVSTRRIWKCKNAHQKQQFSVKVGTVFEDSPISLTKWLPAMWLLVSCKNGISSYELHRALNVTQKTAWFMLHRIRLAIQAGSFEKMSGRIEADETLIGGKARFMHKDRKEKTLKKGRGSAGKAVVMGLLERHVSEKGAEKIIDSLDYDPKKDKTASRVKVSVVPNTKRKTLQGEVRESVKAGSEILTDALASYSGLAPEYEHQFVDHAETYVDGHVHTNGIENFWSLLKRMIKGTYVSVEPFHLFRYLDEEAFRFNERKLTDRERFTNAVGSIVGKRLMYKDLTGKTPDLQTT
jgi:transposase-like protein